MVLGIGAVDVLYLICYLVVLGFVFMYKVLHYMSCGLVFMGVGIIIIMLEVSVFIVFWGCVVGLLVLCGG